MAVQKILTVPYPNLSIILPGTCNARCAFCTWTELKTKSNFLERVKYVLDTMPEHFVSISLTGGEPLSSPYLWDVIKLIDKSRWERVGLTTNGTFLTEEIIDRLAEKLDYINISRHHYDDTVNASIFRITDLPTKKRLKELCSYAKQKGVPISLNCVVAKQLPATIEEIKRFVRFTKAIGADRVQFRKVQGPKSTTAPTKHEELFQSDPTYLNHHCPVCRSGSVTINQVPVVFKSAVLEPSHKLKYWFEAVLQSSGKLTGDWEGTMEGSPENLVINPNWEMDYAIDFDSLLPDMTNSEAVERLTDELYAIFNRDRT